MHVPDGYVGLLGLNASATAKVISRQWNDDDEMSVSLVEETGVPGGNLPTASITDKLSHIPLIGPQVI